MNLKPGRLAIVLLAWAGQALCADTVPGPPPAAQLTYDVHYQSRGYIDLNQAVGPSQSSTVSARRDILSTVTGTEVITVLDRLNTGGVRASLQLVKPVVGVQVDGLSQAGMEQSAAGDLTKTIYFYLDKDARLERTEFPKTYSAIARNLVRAMLSAQQFTLPAGHRLVPAWQAKEAGAQGPYAARYAVLTNAGASARVVKTIRAVTATDTPGDGSQTASKGKVDFTIDAKQGTVRRARASIHEDVMIQNRTAGANEVSVVVQLLSNKALPETTLRAARSAFDSVRNSLSTSDRYDGPVSAEAEASVQKQILGPETTNSIRQALASLDRQGGTNDEQTKLYLKLKALLYLQPAESQVFEKDLAIVDLEKPSAGLISGAFAAVGNIESQNALCAAIEARKKDGAALTALVPGLGSIERPSEKVVAYLSELSRSAAFPEARASALLAMGSAAGNLAKESPDRSNRIVQDLTDRWSAGADKVILMLALGNTGSPKAKAFILAQKADASPAVRRAVATAVSAFQSVESDRALTEMLKTDAEAPVRSAAAQSLAPRSSVVTVKQALLEAVLQDKSENVRIAGMFAMVNLVAKDRQVQEVIQKVAQSDTSEAVREQAAKLLEQAKPEVHPEPSAR